MLQLRLPETSMKTFIELYLNEESTYKRVERLSKSLAGGPVVRVQPHPLHLGKWVALVHQKNPFGTVAADECAIPESPRSSIRSSLDESMEDRIGNLKR